MCPEWLVRDDILNDTAARYDLRPEEALMLGNVAEQQEYHVQPLVQEEEAAVSSCSQQLQPHKSGRKVVTDEEGQALTSSACRLDGLASVAGGKLKAQSLCHGNAGTFQSKDDKLLPIHG